MAQMPIQLVAGRAQSYLAPPLPAPAPAPAKTPGKTSAGASQPLDPGAISGDKLRPGAIDQMTFRQRMAALNRADPPSAYSGGGAVRAPAPAPAAVKLSSAVPTLTPAQLAALGVDISGMDFGAPPPGAESATTGTAEAPAAVTAPAGEIPISEPAAETAAAPEAPLAAAPAAEGAAVAPEDAPVDTPVDPAADPAAAPQQASAAPQSEAPAAEDPEARANAPMPGAHLGKDGVWELPRQPGKDEREWLAGMNAKWRIVENPDSVKLFLGADGKFGFDDFLDIINPLQHIPLINIAYRELTGDTIDGAAELLGALPFGPLSVVSNVTDIAFRSETGAGLAENGLAMLFGTGKAAPDGEDIATASGRVSTPPQIRRGSNR